MWGLQELNKKNKRFTLGEIGKGYGIKDIQDDFIWLKKAGVALPSYNVDEPRAPLEIACNNRLAKIFHSDIGMLCYMLMDTDIQMKLFAKEKQINYGAIFENVVAQELTTHGFTELYYFNSKKQGEVDFLIEYKGNVLPLEVKSGKDYKVHSALSNLLSNEEYDIPQAVVLCNGNVKQKRKVLYLPIYMVMLFKRTAPKSTNITLDLSTLIVWYYEFLKGAFAIKNIINYDMKSIEEQYRHLTDKEKFIATKHCFWTINDKIVMSVMKKFNGIKFIDT